MVAHDFKKNIPGRLSIARIDASELIERSHRLAVHFGDDITSTKTGLGGWKGRLRAHHHDPSGGAELLFARHMARDLFHAQAPVLKSPFLANSTFQALRYDNHTKQLTVALYAQSQRCTDRLICDPVQNRR